MSTPTRETLAARLREQAQAHDDSVRAGDTGRIAEYHRESAVLSRQAADALAATCATCRHAHRPLDEFTVYCEMLHGEVCHTVRGRPFGCNQHETAHPGADTGTEREG